MPRVLVVDDTASIRLLIRTNLEFAGFEVLEAADGDEALEMLARAETIPDCITVDVMMPRRDGVETAEALRRDPRTSGIGIVMVTTQNSPLDIQRGERAGVDAYVTKPFDPDNLVATIADVVRRRTLRREQRRRR